MPEEHFPQRDFQHCRRRRRRRRRRQTRFLYRVVEKYVLCQIEII